MNHMFLKLFVVCTISGILLSPCAWAGKLSTTASSSRSARESKLAQQNNRFTFIQPYEGRKISLHGLPQAIDAVETRSTSDNFSEETYIDVFNRDIQHSVTDIYIPVGSDHFALEVKRTLYQDIWDKTSDDADERKNQPFGKCWSSGLLPSIEFSCDHQAYGSMTVTDHSGQQYSYVAQDYSGGSPIPVTSSGNSAIDMLRCKLTRGLERNQYYPGIGTYPVYDYTFTLPNGTQILYGPLPKPSYQHQYIQTSRMGAFYGYRVQKNAGVNNYQTDTFHLYARPLQLIDPRGMKLVYNYNAGNTGLIPDSITAYSAPNASQQVKLIATLTINQSGNRITSIVDPRGNRVEYIYNTDVVEDFDSASFSEDGMLKTVRRILVDNPTPVADISSDTSYGYWYDGSVNYRKLFVRSVEDANGNTHSFEYEDQPNRKITGYDGSGEYYGSEMIGEPLRLTDVIHDDGNESTTLASLSSTIISWAFRDTLKPEDRYDYDKFCILWKGDDQRDRISANYEVYVTDASGSSWTYDFQSAMDNDPIAGTYQQRKHYIEWYQANDRDVVCCAARKLIISNSNGYKEEIHFRLRDWLISKPDGQVYKLIGLVVVDKLIDSFGNGTGFKYDHNYGWPTYAGYYYGQGISIGATPTGTPFYTYTDKPSGKTNVYGWAESYLYKNSISLNFLPLESVDFEGRKTKTEWHETGTLAGLKKNERIEYGSGTVAQRTNFDYEDVYFPSVITEEEIVASAGDPAWVSTTTKYTVNDRGMPETMTVDYGGGHLNITTTYDYDANNNQIMEIDPNSNTNWFAYDALNRMVAITNADMTVRSFGYDLRGNKIAETNENGHITFWQYDGFNRVTNEVVDMNGNGLIDSADLSTRTTYNDMGLVETVTDPNGTVMKNIYDSLSRLKETILDYGVGAGYLNDKTQYFYDGNNVGCMVISGAGFKPNRIVDARGYETKIFYDKLYREIRREQQVAGSEYTKTTMGYDKVGNLRFTTNWVNASEYQVVENTYDALNRPWKTIYHQPGTDPYIEFDYTSTGLLHEQWDELRRLTTTHYDQAQRPWKVEQPAVDGNKPTTITQYDASGNITNIIDARSVSTEYRFDKRNRKTHDIGPLVWDEENGVSNQAIVVTYYDDIGNVTGILDARQNITTNFYDAANRQTNSIMPIVPVYGGGTTQPYKKTIYDSNGNPRFVEDGNGITVEMQYDALNRLRKTIDGELHEITYGYDANGNRNWIKDQNGNETTFEYDGLNKNTKVIYADNSEETYGYDWLGKKTSRIDANSAETKYDYDIRNRLDLVTYMGTGRTRDYVYDNAGNLLDVYESDNALADVHYTYDALNRIETETTCGVMHTYKYDGAGNRTNALYGITGREITWACDPLNRIATITDKQGYTKTTSVSGGGANLQNAITSAVAGDLLLVDNGIYDPVVINKPITVQSVNGAANATIQTSSGRCAELSDNARLIGFTLTGGKLVDDKGAGALIGKGCLIADCDIVSNTASNVNAYGGGLFLQTGATAQNCLIRNNTALNGGGIFCEKGGLVRNCTIEDNTAESMGGGGIFMQEGGWMANSIVDGNVATNTFARGGGGILFYNDGGKVNSSTISTNTSLSNGAAYSHVSTYVNPGKVGEIKHSIFSNNQPSGTSNGWTGEGNQIIDPSAVSSAPGANLAVSSYASSGTRTTQFKYDLNSNLMKRELPNSVDEYRTYDALNRMVANTNKQQTVTFATVDYQYDPVGNLRQMDDSVSGLHTIPSYATWNWTYDNSYRLKTETIQAGSEPSRKTEFDWDNAGNRTERRKYESTVLTETTSYKPASELNQMLGWTCGETNAVYTYDANGNRQDKFIIVDGDTKATNYEFDEDNRLTKITVRDTEQPKIYSFAYDYRTRRIYRETPTEKTTHVFDGGLSVQEFDTSESATLSANNLTTESIRGEGMGGGVGGMVYSVRNGQVEASHSNHRGDVIARTDNTGNLTWFARYEAYGTRFDEFGATYDRQRGNTKDEEEDLNLLNEGMRWRDLEHGVWLSLDPSGYLDGPNLYRYVHCNPISAFDSIGLETTWQFEPERGIAGAKAMGRGFANTIKGYGDIVKPSTYKNAYAAIKENGLKGTVTAIVDDYKKKASTDEGSAELYGEFAADVLAGGLLTKVSKISKLKMLKKVDAVLPDELVDDAAKLTQTSAKKVEFDKFGNKISREPKSIQDKMTLDAAMEGAGDVKMSNLGDPKYEGWDKIEYKVKSEGGNASNVHYNRNPKTKETADFKFKEHSTDKIHKYEKSRNGGITDK